MQIKWVSSIRKRKVDQISIDLYVNCQCFVVNAKASDQK